MRFLENVKEGSLNRGVESQFAELITVLAELSMGFAEFLPGLAE